MYKIKKERGTWGETTRVYIIDSQGNTVWSQTIPGAESPLGANSKARKRKVGRANAAAQQKLTSLNESVKTQEKSGGEILSKDGLYYTPDGKAFDTYEDAQDHLATQEGKQEFQEDLAEYEERIKTAGATREELASRIAARKQGQLMSALERSILGTGGEQAQVEAVLPQVQESGQRTLADYITQSKAKTQEALVGAKGLDIKGDFDLAQLGLKRSELTDAMQQFLMEQETERATIQAKLDSQPEWWEQILGSTGEAAGSTLATLGIKVLLGA